MKYVYGGSFVYYLEGAPGEVLTLAVFQSRIVLWEKENVL